MNIQFTWQSALVFVSIVIYMIYDHFDKKVVKDEREELIRLKTYQFIQRINLFSLVVFAIANLRSMEYSGRFVVFVLIHISIYSEILAKFYYRKKH